MLCFNSTSRHYYTRSLSLEAEFDLLALEAVNTLMSSLIAVFPPVTALGTLPPLTDSAHEELDVKDNLNVPVSKWDGLLTAEALLRGDKDRRLLDLNLPVGRAMMSVAIRAMDFLDKHDSVSIADSLDHTDGLLPDVPKMSLVEMEAVCVKTNTSLRTVENDKITIILEAGSQDVVTYDKPNDRFTLNTATCPAPQPIYGNSLVSISWNCNSWDVHKAIKVSQLALSSKADAILLMDTRIDHWRTKAAVASFAKHLQKATGKIWDGVATAKHAVHRVGGSLVMYSNRITKPKVDHIIPLGVLTSLEGRWHHQDFTLLSIYRPPEDGGDISLRNVVSSSIDCDLEKRLWEAIEDRMDNGPTWLSGDFNLSPTKLDEKLLSIGHMFRRVPFTGEHKSFRRWDSVHGRMQVSSLDHLVWNGCGPSSCTLADDGWFCLDHIPVICNHGILSSSIHTKPLEFKRNPTLNCNDKGACRRFSKGLERIVARLGPDIGSLSLTDITNESMKLVASICKRRNNRRSPSIWSPLAHVLNLRISALGATVRMGLRGDTSSLHPIILQLRDDERKITLNEDEVA